MSPGLMYDIPSTDPRLSPEMVEFAELLSHAIRCARDEDYFTAGAWWCRAVAAKDLIDDRRKRLLAERLLEAFCDTCDEKQKARRAQAGFGEPLSAVRSCSSARPEALQLRSAPAQRRDGVHVFAGVPQSAGAQGA